MHPDEGDIIPSFLRKNVLVLLNSAMTFFLLFSGPFSPLHQKLVYAVYFLYKSLITLNNIDKKSPYSILDIMLGYVAALVTSFWMVNLELPTIPLLSKFSGPLLNLRNFQTQGQQNILIWIFACLAEHLVSNMRNLVVGAKVLSKEQDVEYGRSNVAGRRIFSKTLL